MWNLILSLLILYFATSWFGVIGFVIALVVLIMAYQKSDSD